MYELNLLKELGKPDIYVKYRSYLEDKTFPHELKPILVAYDQWYTEHDTAPTMTELAVTIGADSLEALEKVKPTLGVIEKLPESSDITPLLEAYKRRQILEDISVKAYDASVGKLAIDKLESLFAQLAKPQLEKIEFVSNDLDELLESVVQTPGLRWRLNFLNRSLGSLRTGDFGFIFARPETGKTTMLASEITYMAEQAHSAGMGPVLWLNNEEQGKKVSLRTWQAALGATVSQLKENREHAKATYSARLGDHLRIIDRAAVHYRYVEKLVESINPSLIIFDQLDKVKGFQADREDLAMGNIYIWARELAKAGRPVIGVCQASTEAEGERWLYMDHVAKAKTAKQAEADFILGIGKTRDAGYDFVRFLNISKNKLFGDPDSEPQLRHGQGEVLIKPEIARYEDI